MTGDAPEQAAIRRERQQAPLAPRRKRLAVYAVLVLIALVSIWFIDRRVMISIEQRQSAAPAPQVTP